MKKILAFVAALMLLQGVSFAQDYKSVPEKDVKLSYVKDFQRQVKDATNVEWYKMDENTFKVIYLDAEKSRQAMVFSSKGSETHYYIDTKYCPVAVRDSVNNLFGIPLGVTLLITYKKFCIFAIENWMLLLTSPLCINLTSAVFA